MAVSDDVAERADFHGKFSWVRCESTEDGSDVPDDTKREWVQLLDRQVRCDYRATTKNKKMPTQARAREDLIIRTREKWNLHDTIYELINRCEQYEKDNAEHTDAVTRGLVALMGDKLKHLRRVKAHWHYKFGHCKRKAPVNFDAAIDALEQEQEREEQGGAEHALRAELEPLRFSALVRRAKEEGVETADLDDAQEGDSPKQAIIELIVALKMSITEDL